MTKAKLKSDFDFKIRVLAHTMKTLERPDIGDDTFKMLAKQAIRLTDEAAELKAQLKAMKK